MSIYVPLCGQVDVVVKDVAVDLRTYTTNGEWHLHNVSAVRNVVKYNCCPEPFPDITFKIHLRVSHINCQRPKKNDL